MKTAYPIISPITGSSEVEKIDEYDIEKVVFQFQKDFQIDVSRFFTELDKLELYKCLQTNVNFFVPYNLSGDSLFYEQLQKRYSKYYKKSRWDLDAAVDLIGSGESVLEIGCGEGHFLQKLVGKYKKICGLELNVNAIEICKNKGFNVTNQVLDEFAKENKNTFDLVCYFQVLEHIEGIQKFLSDSIKCLKSGGKLIVSVPNTESYNFSMDKYHTLNLPPHHMSHWNENSFAKLEGIFPIKHLKTQYQKASRSDKSNFCRLFYLKIFGENTLAKCAFVLTRSIFKLMPLKIKGPFMIAEFEKI